MHVKPEALPLNTDQIDRNWDFPTAGPAPWLRATHNFVGWVPTILGQLSFSMIGIRQKWQTHSTLNQLDEGQFQRFIAVHQRRTAQDQPFWDWLIDVFNPSATQHYILVAQTSQSKIPVVEGKSIRELADTQGVLNGFVYVVPYQDEIDGRWDTDDLISQVKILIADENTHPAKITGEIQDVLEQFGNDKVLVCKFHFALFRTGEIRLWTSEDEARGYTPIDALSEDEFVILDRLPRQVYYFIKETAHTHYHHEPETDQLLPLIRTIPLKSNDNVTQHVANESDWRREILWGLARVVARYRRESDVKQLKRAQGILAYAEAFQATLGRVARPIDLKEKFVYDENITTYDFGHTR